MTVPATIRAGDTVQWIEPAQVDLNGSPATSAVWTFTTYLRHHQNHEGATVVGAPRADGGWLMSIAASVTTGFDTGLWSWQSRITSGLTAITVGSGTFETLPNLSYTGQPAGYDGRSQARQDLDAVDLAIRTIVSKGAKSYTIGSRSYSSQDLSELLKWRKELQAIVAREEAAEKVAAGLGDSRSLYVRFT